MLEYGVDTRCIAEVGAPTGHAIICVDGQGENSIVLLAGANHAITEDVIGAALSESSAGDSFLTQNETNGQITAARMAKELGLRVVYAAAPFEAAAVEAVLPFLDLLVLNEVEAAQLVSETGTGIADLPVVDTVVTKGAAGCHWHHKSAAPEMFEAFDVMPVDTTGAGDTFTGFLVAGLDRGMPMAQAITLGMRAGALMVTRVGTADVIPDLKELQDHFSL